MYLCVLGSYEGGHITYKSGYAVESFNGDSTNNVNALLYKIS